MNWSGRVALVCGAIPAGKVATYGQIAALCGGPRRARQVGRALHQGASSAAFRVVNRQGYLSGAGAFPVPGLQRELLRADGIAVEGDRVDLERYLWQPDEQELTALEQAFAQAGV